MSRGVNKVLLLGNLGKDPELKTGRSGRSYVAFPLATTHQWKDHQSGERKEKAEWHKIVCFGDLAEVLCRNMSKGGRIWLEGRLETKEYKDADGATKYVTNVVAHDIHFLSPPSAQSRKAQYDNQGGYVPPAAPPQSQQIDPQERHDADDIPF